MDKKIDNEEVEKKEAAPEVESVVEEKEVASAERSGEPRENAGAEIQKERQKIEGEDPGTSASDDDDDIKKDLQSENRLAALIKLVELKKVSVPDAIKQAEQAGADVLDRFHDLLIEKGLTKDIKR